MTTKQGTDTRDVTHTTHTGGTTAKRLTIDISATET